MYSCAGTTDVSSSNEMSKAGCWHLWVYFKIAVSQLYVWNFTVKIQNIYIYHIFLSIEFVVSHFSGHPPSKKKCPIILFGPISFRKEPYSPQSPSFAVSLGLGWCGDFEDDDAMIPNASVDKKNTIRWIFALHAFFWFFFWGGDEGICCEEDVWVWVWHLQWSWTLKMFFSRWTFE